MYNISDTQIDYILNDLSARGIKTEGLKQNLLDHVCCIIEKNLEEDGDFENFYIKTIQTFYKNELCEIEEETLLLLTFKNFYIMRKAMIMSGITTALTFLAGSIFKVLQWPGAMALIFLAMALSSVVFMPMLFLFKTKNATTKTNKILIAIGTINGILFCLANLFKIMHWPYAHLLWLLTMFVLAFIFIPLFFFTNIKNDPTKTNTIVISLLLIILVGYLFSMTDLGLSKKFSSSSSSSSSSSLKTPTYLQNEKLVGDKNVK